MKKKQKMIRQEFNKERKRSKKSEIRKKEKSNSTKQQWLFYRALIRHVKLFQFILMRELDIKIYFLLPSSLDVRY